MPRGLSVAARFFWTHAGYSWESARGETQAQGRKRCALNLAAAEGIAREAGYTFEWRVDQDSDSRDFSKSRPAWPLYECVMRDLAGEAAQSLGGVDFGRGASGPYGDYRRVVEAELASQECAVVLASAAGVAS